MTFQPVFQNGQVNVKDIIDMLANISETCSNVIDQLRPDQTARQIKLTREMISNLVSQQAAQATESNTIALQQVEALLLQAMTQGEGMARISTEMGSMNGALQSIADSLKTFSKPSVINQLMNAGALLTSAAAVAHIKKLADEAEKMATSLDRISDNIYSENSRGDKFPGHVHSFVRSMLDKYQDEPTTHYFFVFNQSTTWHAKFDDINREIPLGDRFLGYSHDLDELVAFVVEHARPRFGSEPIVHILMPTISPLAITESLTFPDAMGPFRISGQLGDNGLPLVYMCMPRERDRSALCHIGSLKPKPRYILLQRVGICLPILHRWFSTELEPVFFEDPYFTGVVTSDLLLYSSLYGQVEPVPPRTLGTPREPPM